MKDSKLAGGVAFVSSSCFFFVCSTFRWRGCQCKNEKKVPPPPPFTRNLCHETQVPIQKITKIKKESQEMDGKRHMKT